MAIIATHVLAARRAASAAEAAARVKRAGEVSPVSGDEAASDGGKGDQRGGDDDLGIVPLEPPQRAGYDPASVKHRFRAGDGRPRGPAKGSRRTKSAHEYFAEELAAQIGVRTGDKLMKMPVLKALAKKSVQDALKGDRQARRDVIAIAAIVFPTQPSPASATILGGETDAKLIALFIDGLQMGEPTDAGDVGGDHD